MTSFRYSKLFIAFNVIFLESEKIFLDVMMEQSQQLKDPKRRLSPLSNRQRIIQKAKARSLQISLVIIIAFLVCWIPYNIMMLIFMFWQPNDKVSLFNFLQDFLNNIYYFLLFLCKY